MKKILILMLSVLLILGSFTGCSNNTSTEGEYTLTISGLPEADKVFTMEEINELEIHEISAQSTSSSGEIKTVEAKGVYLKDILTICGLNQSELDSIVLSSSDGYTMEIPNSILGKRDILLAMEVDGESFGTLRSVVPDELAMYWVKDLVKIEVIGEIQIEEASEILLLEGMYSHLDADTYTYDGEDLSAFKVQDMIDEYISEDVEFVNMMSIDGWGKNDKFDIVKEQNIIYEGAEAPLFDGVDLPKGMSLKQTLYMGFGKTYVVSINMVNEKNATTAATLLDIATVADLVDSEMYILTAADGYEVEVAKADLERGVLTISEEGVEVEFEGGSKQNNVKNLISIKAK